MYAPAVPVSAPRLPTRQVVLSSFVTVAPVSAIVAPSRMRMKSARSTPVTGSLNVTSTELTAVSRGSGETSTTSTVGAVVSPLGPPAPWTPPRFFSSVAPALLPSRTA
jgi:hypothetical protein